MVSYFEVHFFLILPNLSFNNRSSRALYLSLSRRISFENLYYWIALMKDKLTRSITDEDFLERQLIYFFYDCRKDFYSGLLYDYQAVEINTSSNEYYTITFSSSIDIYRYLHNGTFDSKLPSQNLSLQNGDDTVNH